LIEGHTVALRETGTAASYYAARVDAVLAQRTRLRGPQPSGDLFAGIRPDGVLLRVDPHRPSNKNIEIIASYIVPDDVVVDVGGGGGRVSLPLALRCREVINVEPSAAMGAGFTANATRAGLTNTRVIEGDWLTIEPPIGTVALVNHVTYLTREIVPFIEKLERAGRRRVLMTINNPPQPSQHRILYEQVHGEPEEIAPGHQELLNVLWEMDILPDVQVLPLPTITPSPVASREAAISGAMERLKNAQWSFWPLAPDVEQRLCGLMERRFDDFFTSNADGFMPRWITPGREILITWQPANRGR
jgi:SAM-dependent methyltransferase